MKENKMGNMKINKLIWTMGLPMIFSMVLQAIYNVVDTIFVVNKEGLGQVANQALTFAFPVQILLIALGVGTGVGINAMLSKSLGEGNKDQANRTVGCGIFLGIVITLLFLLFGIFGTEIYMKFMSRNIDEAVFSKKEIVKMGKDYLSICCIFSLGAIGYAFYERFLQATGKTMYSTIAQIVGALLNIILDWVLIYYTDLGVSGAAIATIIGQFASLILAMIFHYILNKEIDGNIEYIKPKMNIIKNIYKIGLPAAIMQGLLAIMMFVTIIIIGTNKEFGTILQGTFGIYYKIMQIALFATFGLSNTLISITSFNYGLKNKERIYEISKYGIINTIIVSIIITIIFQIFAKQITNLFALTLTDGNKEIIDICVIAIHISTLGYVFMGVVVAIQGVLQGLRDIYGPIILSLCRLIIFVVPFAFIFINTNNPIQNFWWTFPIAEFLTLILSIIIFKYKIAKI